MSELKRTRSATGSLRTISHSKRGVSRSATQKISDQEFSCLKQGRSVDAIRWALTSKMMEDPDSGSLQPVDVNKLYLDKVGKEVVFFESNASFFGYVGILKEGTLKLNCIQSMHYERMYDVHVVLIITGNTG